MCYICKTEEESLLHLITECQTTVLFVKKVLRCIGATHVMLNEDFVLGYSHDKLSCVQRYIINILQWTIWRVRNISMVKNIPITSQCLKLEFNVQASAQLTTTWLRYRSRDKVDLFNKIYLQNNTWCTVGTTRVTVSI